MRNRFIILGIGIAIIGGIEAVFAYPMFREARILQQWQRIEQTEQGAARERGAWDTIKCAMAYAECASSLVECERGARVILGRCGKEYDRRIRGCEQFMTRANRRLAGCGSNRAKVVTRYSLEIDRCGKDDIRCKERANARYKENPDRLTRALQRCEDRRLRCVLGTERTKERGLARYEHCKERAQAGIVEAQERGRDCREKAEDKNLRCEEQAADRMGRLLQRCRDKGDRCIRRVDEMCR